MLANLDEIHGGSPWGAGTFSAGDGSRQPTELELNIATAQGKAFYEAVAKAHAWLDGTEKKPVVANTTQNNNNNNTSTTSNGAAPVAKAGSTTGPKEKTEKDSEGPCGLPTKCDIM
jgi:hypothetical protein